MISSFTIQPNLFLFIKAELGPITTWAESWNVLGNEQKQLYHQKANDMKNLVCDQQRMKRKCFREISIKVSITYIT